MNITFKGQAMHLLGDIIKEGDELKFTATNTDFSDFDSAQMKGHKVISVFPSIDTSVCDEQTVKIKDLADKYKDINFISISLDLPTAQARWCAAKAFNNLKIVSDYKTKDFANKTSLFIKELHLLHRSILILNKENIVTKILVKKEVTDMPDFKQLENELQKI